MVTPFGRGLFFVDSHSRDGLQFLVDLEPCVLMNWDTGAEEILPCQCDCEDFIMTPANRPCKHIEEAALWCVSRMELPFKAELSARKQVKQLLKELFE